MFYTVDVISTASYQIHILIWSDLNQFHHPQTDKLKTACNLSDMRTTPLPRECKNRENYNNNNNKKVFFPQGKKGEKESKVSRVYYKLSNESFKTERKIIGAR